MSNVIQRNEPLSVERIESVLRERVQNEVGEDAALLSMEVKNYDEFFGHMHDKKSIDDIGDVQIEDIAEVKPYVVDQLQIINKNTKDIECKFHYGSSEEDATSSVTETSWTFSVVGFGGVAAQGALAAIGASATKQVKEVSGLFKRNLSGNSVELTCKVPKNTGTVMKKRIRTTKKRVKFPLKVCVPANFHFTCSYQYKEKQAKKGSKRYIRIRILKVHVLWCVLTKLLTKVYNTRP